VARKRDQRAQEEIKKCAQDFRYFCRYLKIADKRGRLVPLVLLPAQESFLATVELHPWTYILKARQLGMTTVIAARMFWKALFTPNFKVGVLAHSGESAQAIFEIYRRLYKHLPKFLEFRTERANVREIKFFHGGMVRVTTANSENFRGTTYQALHCSEFAFWNDTEKTIRSAFQTCGPDAEILLETTANGLNDAHRLWREENGFHSLFVPWMEDPGYSIKTKPKTINPKLKEYAVERGLSEGQLNWLHETYATKCMSNWNTFLQEYPSSAEEAFIVSGKPFFNIVFPDVQHYEGLKVYAEPVPYHIYTVGVDVASGSPSGDYSAFCVMDVTNKKSPQIVSGYYARVPPHEFGEMVRKSCIKYDALAVVESNSYGLAILEYLMGKEYAYIFKRTQYDKMAKRWVERLGFNTNVNTRPVLLSKILEFISNQWLIPDDRCLQFEMNTFVYNDKGKPEAGPKKHDDMVFAVALAITGMDQVDVLEQVILAKKPRSIAEVLQFEMSTGKLYNQQGSDYHRDRWGTPETTSPTDMGADNPPPGR
jgi:hypothetical protein